MSTLAVSEWQLPSLLRLLGTVWHHVPRSVPGGPGGPRGSSLVLSLCVLAAQPRSVGGLMRLSLLLRRKPKSRRVHGCQLNICFYTIVVDRDGCINTQEPESKTSTIRQFSRQVQMFATPSEDNSS